eukprot:3323784-Rhodomonas_salina.2
MVPAPDNTDTVAISTDTASHGTRPCSRAPFPWPTSKHACRLVYYQPPKGSTIFRRVSSYLPIIPAYTYPHTSIYYQAMCIRIPTSLPKLALFSYAYPHICLLMLSAYAYPHAYEQYQPTHIALNSVDYRPRRIVIPT